MHSTSWCIVQKYCDKANISSFWLPLLAPEKPDRIPWCSKTKLHFNNLWMVRLKVGSWSDRWMDKWGFQVKSMLRLLFTLVKAEKYDRHGCVEGGSALRLTVPWEDKHEVCEGGMDSPDLWIKWKLTAPVTSSYQALMLRLCSRHS